MEAPEVARHTITIHTDDLDGTEIKPGKGGSVRFSLDGAEYEIDLSTKNRTALGKILAPYIENARIVRKAAKRGRQQARPLPREVRAWAQSTGLEIPARGRIPKTVYDAYEAAT